MTAGTVQAALFMEELLRQVDKRIDAKLALLDGAHRDYVWSVADPTVVTPPPPLIIDLPCRPVDLMAVCQTAPSGSAPFDVQRSIDGGSSYTSMLVTLTTIAAGQRFGAGATFKWEEPDTRALVAPLTEGALPLQLRPGDLVKLVVTSTTARSLSVQLHVQRVGEYTRGGQ